jgi:hypothetical protein
VVGGRLGLASGAPVPQPPDCGQIFRTAVIAAVSICVVFGGAAAEVSCSSTIVA